MARIPVGAPEVSLLKTPEMTTIVRPHHHIPNTSLLDGSLWDPAGEGGREEKKSRTRVANRPSL